MRKTAITITAISAFLLTACGGEGEEGSQEGAAPDAETWFAENCPPEVSPTYEEVDHEGEPSGEQYSDALTQGAIRPPSGLDESAETIGIYSHDKVADTMTQEGEVASDDLFCLEQGILDDGWKMMNTNQIEGDASQNDTEVKFSYMRSPEHPDGVWVEYDYGTLGWSVEGNLQDCEDEWSPATDVTPVEEADSNEEPFESDKSTLGC